MSDEFEIPEQAPVFGIEKQQPAISVLRTVIPACAQGERNETPFPPIPHPGQVMKVTYTPDGDIQVAQQGWGRQWTVYVTAASLAEGHQIATWLNWDLSTMLPGWPPPPTEGPGVPEGGGWARYYPIDLVVFGNDYGKPVYLYPEDISLTIDSAPAQPVNRAHPDPGGIVEITIREMHPGEFPEYTAG